MKTVENNDNILIIVASDILEMKIDSQSSDFLDKVKTRVLEKNPELKAVLEECSKYNSIIAKELLEQDEILKPIIAKIIYEEIMRVYEILKKEGLQEAIRAYDDLIEQLKSYFKIKNYKEKKIS